MSAVPTRATLGAGAPLRREVRSDDVLLRSARAGLCLVLFLSSLLVARVGEYTAGDLVLIVVAGATLFAVAASQTVRRERGLPVLTLLILSTVVGGGALAGLRAQSSGSTLSVVARLVLVIVVLPWLVRVLMPRQELVRRAMSAFAAGAGVCGAGTLLQFVFGASVIPGTGITDAGRFAGFTQNVSDTGGVCCAGVVLGLGLLITAPTRRARAVPLLSLLGAAFGLILSGSVSGLIGTVLGGAVLLACGVLRARGALAALASSAAFLAVVVGIQTAAGALNPLQRILQTTGNSADARYDTAGSRISTYTEALRKIGESPVLGAGLDPNSTIVDGIYPAHNLFIAAMYCGGVLLLIGIVLAVLRPLCAGAIRWRREPLVGIGLAVASAELFFAMTAPSLYNRYFWIPVALLLGALALRSERQAAPEDRALGAREGGDPASGLESGAQRERRSAVAYARAGSPGPRRPGGRHAG